MPVAFQWYLDGKVLGQRAVLQLRHGDVYAMSEKATGCDWKLNRKGYTLRHAAGAVKYTHPELSRKSKSAKKRSNVSVPAATNAS